MSLFHLPFCNKSNVFFLSYFLFPLFLYYLTSNLILQVIVRVVVCFLFLKKRFMFCLNNISFHELVVSYQKVLWSHGHMFPWRHQTWRSDQPESRLATIPPLVFRIIATLHRNKKQKECRDYTSELFFWTKYLNRNKYNKMVWQIRVDLLSEKR